MGYMVLSYHLIPSRWESVVFEPQDGLSCAVLIVFSEHTLAILR
jgi:hypothetical protein